MAETSSPLPNFAKEATTVPDFDPSQTNSSDPSLSQPPSATIQLPSSNSTSGGSGRFNLKISKAFKADFQHPYDAFVVRLLKMAPLVKELKFSETSTQAMRNFPRGSDWTVWLNDDSKREFLQGKAETLPHGTHSQFINILLALYQEQEVSKLNKRKYSIQPCIVEIPTNNQAASDAPYKQQKICVPIRHAAMLGVESLLASAAILESQQPTLKKPTIILPAMKKRRLETFNLSFSEVKVPMLSSFENPAFLQVLQPRIGDPFADISIKVLIK